MKTTLARMRQLIGTTADWAANDIVIGDGELAVERLDAAAGFKMKIGDGVKRYSELPNFGVGDDGVTIVQPWPGSVPRTQHEKNAELPSTADTGASAGAADNSAALQAAFDKQFGAVLPELYAFSTPLKIPSLSHFEGKRAGIAHTGIVAVVQTALKKTTNDTVDVENFQSHVVTPVDCLAYLDPDWIDAGQAYPQKVSIERISFEGNDTPNAVGIYIEQGGGHTFRELDFTGCIDAIRAKEAWLCTLERVHAFGKINWRGGTSVTFTDCWTGATNPGISGGYDFESLIYSTMNSCASDHANNTAYRFNFCDMVLNACGCENATTATADSGTAVAIMGGNRLVLNGFVAVPVENQVVALMSVGAQNEVQINGGSSYFPNIDGVDCPDLYVHGDASTVVIRERLFLNGTKDDPIIQFKNGVTTSKVIVHFGDNHKIYYSTGTGNTLVETFSDKGTFLPVFSFDTPGVAPTYAHRSGSWQKLGNIVMISGKLRLASLGTGSGPALLGGFPGFASLGDTLINFSVVTGIAGGPIIGTLNAGAATAILQVRGPGGDSPAGPAVFSDFTELWFNFAYSVPYTV